MRLKVFGWLVKVNYIDLSETHNVGYYDFAKKQIYIHNKLSAKEKLATLIHELFHASLDRMAFNQTKIDHDLQEILVENLTQVLVENFKLTKK